MYGPPLPPSPPPPIPPPPPEPDVESYDSPRADEEYSSEINVEQSLIDNSEFQSSLKNVECDLDKLKISLNELCRLIKEPKTMKDSQCQTDNITKSLSASEFHSKFRKMLRKPKQQMSYANYQWPSTNDSFRLVNSITNSEGAQALAAAMPQYVYDEASNSIYDPQMAAYYFPEHKLYFDPRFQSYYAFDEATGSFIFHSQPNRPATINKSMEVDGSTYELVQTADDVRMLSALRDQATDISASYPPCLRIILTKPGENCSNRRGSLFVIPSCIESALVGSSENADIRLVSENIHSIHARIQFCNGEYAVQSCLIDGGCVWVNDRDIGQLSMPLSHDSILMCGDCELLVHQHPGNTTCTRCEPSFYIVQTTEPPCLESRSTILALKKKYGLLSKNKAKTQYNDRAEKRRKQQANMIVRKNSKKSIKMGWKIQKNSNGNT